MFEECMYLYIFSGLCFVHLVLVDMLEEQSREERDPCLEVEENIMIFDSREKHCNNFVEDNIKEKGEINYLRWEVYMKER